MSIYQYKDNQLHMIAGGGVETNEILQRIQLLEDNKRVNTYTSVSQFGLTVARDTDLDLIVEAMPNNSRLTAQLSTSFSLLQFTSEEYGNAANYGTLEIVKAAKSRTFVNIYNTIVNDPRRYWCIYYKIDDVYTMSKFICERAPKQIDNFDTWNPVSLNLKRGEILQVYADNNANSPWTNTTAGTIQLTTDPSSSSNHSYTLELRRSGGTAGIAYRQHYGSWSDWKII